MKIIVGCELSGRVREAFRKRGHKAWSCDIEPALDGSKYHIQGYIEDHLDDDWDMGIFFPPCTYLCSSGLHWNKRRPGRAEKTEEALKLVNLLLGCNIDKIALENPRGCIGTRIRKSDQVIQPYQFGEDASKETHIWLKNLPLLVPTLYVPPRITADGKKRWGNQTDSGQNKLGPSEDRAMLRGLTYQGIADAMGDQWG